MKKGIILLGVSLFCLTGCGNETKTMTCTRILNQDDIKMDLRYEVQYTGDVVDSIKSIEKVTSDSNDVLDMYKESIEDTYKPYAGIEHYNTDVKIEGNTLTSTVTIDYKNVDVNKLIEIDSANSQLIKDGKVKLADIETVYNSVGATCEK